MTTTRATGRTMVVGEALEHLTGLDPNEPLTVHILGDTAEFWRDRMAHLTTEHGLTPGDASSFALGVLFSAARNYSDVKMIQAIAAGLEQGMAQR